MVQIANIWHDSSAFATRPPDLPRGWRSPSTVAGKWPLHGVAYTATASALS